MKLCLEEPNNTSKRFEGLRYALLPLPSPTSSLDLNTIFSNQLNKTNIKFHSWPIGGSFAAMDAFFCYTDAKKDFPRKSTRPPCCSFFKKTPVEDVVPEEDVDDPVEAVEEEEVQVDDDILD
ncbi:hypothetical protein E2C01_000850 [Portunus trituberculatus]|uniref:Uncharacterized protein n=1 Tax=Portunus trituberculatus TaxID=210409 RepID=A0A5B7CFE8_PORTR|nr:hypothetical protein [Portunus trituberculatus]